MRLNREIESFSWRSFRRIASRLAWILPKAFPVCDTNVLLFRFNTHRKVPFTIAFYALIFSVSVWSSLPKALQNSCVKQTSFLFGKVCTSFNLGTTQFISEMNTSELIRMPVAPTFQPSSILWFRLSKAPEVDTNTTRPKVDSESQEVNYSQNPAWKLKRPMVWVLEGIRQKNCDCCKSTQPAKYYRICYGYKRSNRFCLQESLARNTRLRTIIDRDYQIMYIGTTYIGSNHKLGVILHVHS
ncbi:hypothetical protein VNO77_44670 [Canavalia gladiata]|uniref:Uncharacterized protein n=1 Tax=Canavalia gladiata TaxID=3824 RepID=A0AAN9JWC0_CANGL